VPPPSANRGFLDRLRQSPSFRGSVRLDELAELHGADNLALLQAVIDQKLITKNEGCRAWADGLEIAYVDVLASVIMEDAIARVPAEIARKIRAISLYVIDGVLTVAMATPEDAATIHRLELIVEMPVSAVFGLPCEIEHAIAVHYSTEKTLAESLAELEKSDLFNQPELASDRLASLAESKSLTYALDEVLHFALRERATDVHIEAQESVSRIRFRIDGNLREILSFPAKLHRAIVIRLKILCNINISETRFPQDGRFSIPIGSNTANFRFSSIPSMYGEKAVVRILATTGARTVVTLDRMLMSQNVLQPFRRLIENPNGMIFVTGPTGSGKTTTLYAALHEINRQDINITTIEDPIEIPLKGVTQSQVNSHIDLKFSTLLRGFMRQDPDVILIGEIRDHETAKIATEAALTGHLVFATLHTNSAAQAIVRLLEIGVEAYMVAPSIIGVLGQRLAARLCPECKEAYRPSREVLMKYFHEEGLTDVNFYRGRGCPHCRGTGFRGRVAFHELVLITDEIRQLISDRRPAQEIERAAAKVGYRSLRYDGLKKVLLGLTTIEEVEQNTSFEWAT